MPILIVDDNEVQRYALRRILDRAGFKTVPAETAKAATALAKSEHPSVILLDIHLPDGDGFEVFNRVRSDPATSDIPVVFHSSTLGAGEARFRVDALGAEGFLTYPIEPTTLYAVIKGVTARRPPKMLA
jgi:CheY-like chemotaxis protein